MPIPTWIERKANNPELIVEILRVMKARHSGKSRAATKDALMMELFGIYKGAVDYESLERLFRRCIELGNQDHEGLVVSDASVGYWWAESLSDGLEPAEKNMARAMTILKNAKTVLENIKKTYGGQMGMGL